MKDKKIRPSIRLMIEDGMSPFSIVAAHGRFVSPDEAELLKKYEESYTPTKPAPPHSEKNHDR